MGEKRTRYAGLMENDIVDSVNGMSVSFWVQGCPFRCKGCHNKLAWDFDGGLELPENIENIIIEKIFANDTVRNFSVLGGEPLCEENRELVLRLIKHVKLNSPDSKILLWTGYELDTLKKLNNDTIDNILSMVDYLIDGQYIEELRDTVSLSLRGSKNQRIYKRVDVTFVQRLIVDKPYRFIDVTKHMDKLIQTKFS